AADPAEAALREALGQDATLAEAEDLLAALLDSEGRLADLASLYEDASARVQGEKRARLLMKAAHTYKERAKRPHEAAAALLAARAAAPDDLDLTAEAADMLHEIGRPADAAELDEL